MMANVRADRAVKVESVKILDRIVVANQFIKPIEGKGGKLIAVYLTLKNTGKESGDMAFSRFRLVDSLQIFQIQTLLSREMVLHIQQIMQGVKEISQI
jgi:hypothetical protein